MKIKYFLIVLILISVFNISCKKIDTDLGDRQESNNVKNISNDNVLKQISFRREISEIIKNIENEEIEMINSSHVIPDVLYEINSNLNKKISDYEEKYLDENKDENIKLNKIVLRLLATNNEILIANKIKQNIEKKLENVEVVLNIVDEKEKERTISSNEYDLLIYNQKNIGPNIYGYLSKFDFNHNSYFNKNVEELKEHFLQKDYFFIDKYLIDKNIVVPIYNVVKTVLQQPIIKEYDENALYNIINYNLIDTSLTTKGKKIIRTAIDNDIDNFEILYYTNSEEFNLLSMINSTLFKIEKNKLINSLIDNYEVLSNGLKYKFTLKDNLYWSNYDKLISNDILEGLKNIVNNGKEHHKQLLLETKIKNIKDIIDKKVDISEIGVEILNDREFIFELSDENEYLPLLLTNPIFAPYNIDFKNENKNNILQQKILSSGPYIVKEIDIGNYIFLEKNELYHDKNNVVNDGVLVRIEKDINKFFDLFDTNQIDFINIDKKNIDRVSDLSNLQKIPLMEGFYLYINF